MKNKVRNNREMGSLIRAGEMLVQNFHGITSVTFDDVERFGADIMINGTIPAEVKSCALPLLGNKWFSVLSGYTGAVRYKENDPSTGFTLDELENTTYDYQSTSCTYHYGFPESLSEHNVVMLNLDCVQSPVIKCKFSKCVRNHVALIFEFTDCWALFKWSDLESARLCNIEMKVRTGHTKELGGSHQPCWERKVALDLDKARIIVK